MKRALRYTLSITVFLPLVISCETEKIIFTDLYHVRFTESTLTERESYSKPLRIEVHVAGPAPEKDITVFYNVGGSAREGIDYMILGTRGKVKIKSGEYFGYIEVQLINNANNILRSQDVIFILHGVDDNTLQTGQDSDGIGTRFTLTILDDCLLGGNYAGSRSGLSTPVRRITITSQDCETYRLSNWNVNYFAYPFDLGLNFVDNFDNTITIHKQDENVPLEGIGTVDLEKRQINITLTLFLNQLIVVEFTLIPD
jgi:hypothetical protein